MAGFIGFGSDFQMSTNGGSTYASLGSMIDIGLPDQEVKDVDTSYITMTNAVKQFIAGLIDPGKAKCKIIFDKTAYNTAIANLRVNNLFKIIFSDKVSTNSVLAFSGYIAGVGGEIPLEDKIVADITVRVSGIVTFTAGT